MEERRARNERKGEEEIQKKRMEGREREMKEKRGKK